MPPAPPVITATLPLQSIHSPTSPPRSSVLERSAEQVVAVFDAHGDADQRIVDAHAGPAFRPHLEIDRVRNRNRQGPVVAQIAGL
jgi:hypothetical protein